MRSPHAARAVGPGDRLLHLPPGDLLDHAVDHLQRFVIVGAVLMLLAAPPLLLFNWRGVAHRGWHRVRRWPRAAPLFDDVQRGGVRGPGDRPGRRRRRRRRQRRQHHRTGRRAQDAARAKEAGPTCGRARGRARDRSDDRARLAALLSFALLPIFLINGLSGDSFFPPLAAASCAGRLAARGHDGHARAGPPPVPAAASRRDSPVAGRLQRGTTASSHRSVHASRRSWPSASRGPDGRRSSFLAPDRSVLPRSTTRNLLVRGTARTARRCPRWTASRPRRPPSSRAAAGRSDVGAQVGQASLGDQRRSAELRRDVGQHRPVRRLRQDGQAVKDGGRRLPRADHEVLTYSKNSMSEVLAPASASHGAGSSAATSALLQNEGGRGAEGRRPASTASANVARAAPSTEPTMEVEVDLAKAQAPASSPATSAGRRRRCCRASGSATSSRTRRSSTSSVWSTPETRERRRVEDLLIDTPDGGHVGRATWPTCASAPRRRHRPRRTSPASSTSRPTSRAATSARWRRQGAADREVDFPLEYHAELIGDYSDQQGAQRRSWASPSRPRSASSCCCRRPSASWRLAISPSGAAGRARRRRVRGVARRRSRHAGHRRGPARRRSALAVRQSVAARSAAITSWRTEDGVAFGPELVARGARERLGADRHATVAIVAGVPARDLLRGRSRARRSSTRWPPSWSVAS